MMKLHGDGMTRSMARLYSWEEQSQHIIVGLGHRRGLVSDMDIYNRNVMIIDDLRPNKYLVGNYNDITISRFYFLRSRSSQVIKKLHFPN